MCTDGELRRDRGGAGIGRGIRRADRHHEHTERVVEPGNPQLGQSLTQHRNQTGVFAERFGLSHTVTGAAPRDLGGDIDAGMVGVRQQQGSHDRLAGTPVEHVDQVRSVDLAERDEVVPVVGVGALGRRRQVRVRKVALDGARAELRKGAAGKKDLYGLWLTAVMRLAEPAQGAEPSFMKTDAYADYRINSALVGFGQIRHNYVLLAGQGYDA